MGKNQPIPTDLSGNAVEEISSNLRRLLADVFALYVKTKNFHWHSIYNRFGVEPASPPAISRPLDRISRVKYGHLDAKCWCRVVMTLLTPSPLMVALVQAATSLPVFFAALPAGALADVIDRRRLLLVTQGWMLVAAAALDAESLCRDISRRVMGGTHAPA